MENKHNLSEASQNCSTHVQMVSERTSHHRRVSEVSRLKLDIVEGIWMRWIG